LRKCCARWAVHSRDGGGMPQVPPRPWTQVLAHGWLYHAWPLARCSFADLPLGGFPQYNKGGYLLLDSLIMRGAYGPYGPAKAQVRPSLKVSLVASSLTRRRAWHAGRGASRRRSDRERGARCLTKRCCALHAPDATRAFCLHRLASQASSAFWMRSTCWATQDGACGRCA
jgi:hypothetical protein